MTNAQASTKPSDLRRDYVVRAPRMTDGIGKTLRNAFSGLHGVPRDMQFLLSELDKSSAH